MGEDTLRAVAWYQEGERDHDFLCHLIDELIPQIAKLAAAVEELRCCGNCAGSEYHGGAFGCFKDADYLFLDTDPSGPCQFEPSCWTARDRKETDV
jgi:hypothetical protein